MVKKYSFGQVFRTESVPSAMQAEKGQMPHMTVNEEKMSLTYRMASLNMCGFVYTGADLGGFGSDTTEDLMFRPLAFDHPEDARCRTIEDQLYLGDELMIAPVYEQNARGRYVYLPERMKMLRYTREGIFREKILEKGDHYVEVALSDVVFFLREGHAIPLSAGGQCVDDIDFGKLSMLSFGEGAVYEYYHDDGLSRDYEDPGNWSMLSAAGD